MPRKKLTSAIMIDVLRETADILPTGAYIQGHGKLRQVENGILKHCCLGVICDRLVQRGFGSWEWHHQTDRTHVFRLNDERDAAFLPESVAALLPCKVDGGSKPGQIPRDFAFGGRVSYSLSGANDSQVPFAAIAPWIREIADEMEATLGD